MIRPPQLPGPIDVRTDRDHTRSTPGRVAETIDRLVAAFNAHDAEGYTACFVPDGWFVNVVGQRLSGHAEILAAHQFIFNTGAMARAHLTITDLQSRPLGDDHALVEFTWTTTGHAAPARAASSTGTDADDRNGILSATLVRQEADTWAIVSAINTDYTFRWKSDGAVRAR